jgi:hypothetical protein
LGDVEEELPIVIEVSAAARQLADSVSVLQDLELVLSACEQLSELIRSDSDQPDSASLHAWWTAALVTYVRCFSSGKRGGLSYSDVQSLGENAVAIHETIKGMRDKNIAHSVNPFEQVRVGLVLSPQLRQRTAVEGVAVLASRLLTLDVQWVDALSTLVRGLKKGVAERCETTKPLIPPLERLCIRGSFQPRRLRLDDVLLPPPGSRPRGHRKPGRGGQSLHAALLR